MNTHPDFQSIVSTIKNVHDIEKIVDKSILNAKYILKKTTPVESEYWTMEDFNIDPENFDRLYYVKKNTNNYPLLSRNTYTCIRLVGRMIYRKKMIYFDFFYHYIYIAGKLSCQFGYIYFSEDPFVFIDIICLEEVSSIKKSLRHDGIFPNLSYICQQKIHKSLVHLQIPLHVQKRLNVDTNVNEHAKNEYRRLFHGDVFDILSSICNISGVCDRLWNYSSDSCCC